MGKLNKKSFCCFFTIFTLVFLLAIKTASLAGKMDLGDFKGVTITALFLFFIYIYSMIFFRLILIFFNVKSGKVEKGSTNEIICHIYLLFYVVVFNPLIRSGIVQAPILRLIYTGLGAKFGRNTYSSGIIDEPHLVEVGNDTTLGQNSLLIPHVIEYDEMGYYPIKIGNKVMVGANATIMAGVVIEDNSIIAAGAMVTKGTHIKNGEIWGGLPAKKLSINNKKKV